MGFVLVMVSLYKYAVLPYESRNVDTTTFSIMFDYLREELSKYGNVLNKQKSFELLNRIKECDTDTCFKRISNRYQVENIVFLNADRLGEKYIIRIKVFNSKKGKFIFNGRDIGTEEDLDILIRRFSRAIYEGKPVEKVVTLETITEVESKEEPRRRLTLKSFGCRIGSIFPITGFYDSDNYKPSNLTRVILEFFYELKNAGIGVGIGGAFFARGSGVEFPLRYFPSQGNITSFLEIAPSYYFMPDVYEDEIDGKKISGGNGPGIAIGGGFAFFRTYETNFILNAKYLFILNNGPDSGLELTFGVLTSDREILKILFGYR